MLLQTLLAGWPRGRYVPGYDAPSYRKVSAVYPACRLHNTKMMSVQRGANEYVLHHQSQNADKSFGTGCNVTKSSSSEL